MTNIHDCIETGIRLGEVDEARGREAQSAYAQLRDRYATRYGEAQAAAMAAKDVKEATAKAARQRFHKVVNQLQTMRRIRALIEQSPDPAVAIRNLLEHSEGSGFTGEAVKSLAEGYKDSINFTIRQVLEKVGLNVTGGTRDRALLEEMVRELHGEATGNASARALAEAVATAEERMVGLFNDHGGDIAILKNRGMPQSHDGNAMRKAGFDAWRSFIETRLAWDKIPDFRTGKPFAAGAGEVPPRDVTDSFLRDIFDGILTRGWDDEEPSLAMGGKALYAQRAEHRVLHFKDGTAQLEYNRSFGTADPFTALIGNLHGLAEDVALMRVLGPNPRLGLNYAIQVAKKRAADLGDPELDAQVKTLGARTRTMLAHQDGSANIAEHQGMAQFFSGTRAVLTSVQLGSAVISSVTDAATIQMAAQAMGMSGTNVLARSVQLTFSKATRETAAQMGYVAETLADTAGGAQRFMGGFVGGGIPDRLAGFTLRATGLTFLTDMRKVAFQMEFAGHMAANSDFTFSQIDEPLRALFQNRGITAADWDRLRDLDHMFVAPNGARFISPLYWLESRRAAGFKGSSRAVDEGLALRVQMAIREQLEYAVPSGTLEGQALLKGGTAPGTWYGELLRSSAGYKNFAVSLTIGQYRRIAAIPTTMGKVAYGAQMAGMLVLLGATAVQLKELVKGNDPRPMFGDKAGAFWWAAVFQSGGLGIFGDFFAAETSRTGGGIGQALAGPVAGAIGDFVQPLAANAMALAQGKDTRLGADAAGLVRAYTPFLTSAWYARTAFARIVGDNLQAFLDPRAEAAMRRRIRQMQREYGTQPFIPPTGSGQPLRAPDFSNIFGGTP